MQPLDLTLHRQQLSVVHMISKSIDWERFILPVGSPFSFWCTRHQAVLLQLGATGSLVELASTVSWALGFQQVSRPSLKIYSASTYDASLLLVRFQKDQVHAEMQARDLKYEGAPLHAPLRDHLSRKLALLDEAGARRRHILGVLDGQELNEPWSRAELQEYLTKRLKPSSGSPKSAC